MNDLYLKHSGETAWIVGKGPSLEFLRAEHFGPGPVITLNHAIIAVEQLGLSNKIYSSQKDGECSRPENATLILHDQESAGAYPDYSDRYVFSLGQLGLNENVFSLIFVIRLVQFMGCSELKLLCCDLHTNGDNRTFMPGEGLSTTSRHLNQLEHLPHYLAGWKYQHITPTGGQNDIK